MGIAMTLQQYLDDNHVAYDVTTHKKTGCSSMTARASHVSGDSLAKGVVLKWGGTHILAVLPASRHIELDKIRGIVDGPVTLASEQEASQLFPDCEVGAVPALGVAYKLASVVDERLEDRDDIYFEGGDHCSLVHISGEQFDRLMYGVPHGRFSA